MGFWIAYLLVLWWSKHQTKQLEKLKCIIAPDVEIFLQIQKILDENNIFFNQRNYSNYQESFNQLGLLTKAPKEVWINDSEEKCHVLFVMSSALNEMLKLN